METKQPINLYFKKCKKICKDCEVQHLKQFRKYSKCALYNWHSLILRCYFNINHLITCHMRLAQWKEDKSSVM